MKKILVTLLVICCSTVTYATSVSVMLAAPEVATADSATATPTDVSAILTVVYGVYSPVYGKGGSNYTTSALATSSQQGGSHSNSANMEAAGKYLLTDQTGDDTPTSNPSSPTPVPEPHALLLAGIGLAGLGLALRLRR